MGKAVDATGALDAFGRRPYAASKSRITMEEDSMLLRKVVVGALALGIVAVAQAQMRAPKGPVEITVGSGPGGTPDVIMRNIVKIMTEEKIVTIPVVVQNRVGGSHSNAYNYVLGKKGDENLLLTLASPVFTTPIMQGTTSVISQVVPIAGFIQRSEERRVGKACRSRWSA